MSAPKILSIIKPSVFLRRELLCVIRGRQAANGSEASRNVDKAGGRVCSQNQLGQAGVCTMFGKARVKSPPDLRGRYNTRWIYIIYRVGTSRDWRKMQVWFARHRKGAWPAGP